MEISEEIVEKTKESIDNPIEKTRLDRLYLLYKLYSNAKPQRISSDMIDSSINKIKTKLKTYFVDSSSQEEMEDILNRFISVKSLRNSVKRNKKELDTLLYELTDLEKDLLIVPTFPNYLGRVLEGTLKKSTEKKLSRGKR